MKNNQYLLNIQTNIIYITSSNPETWAQAIAQSKKNTTIDQALIQIKTTEDFPPHHLPLLLDLLNQNEIIPLGIQSTQSSLKGASKNLNLPYFEHTQIDTQTIEIKEPSKIIWGNIITGQKKHFKDDLIIIGNIQKGAQVSSNKSIQIYGKCQGQVFAGLTQKNAIIYTQNLQAQAIGIHHLYIKHIKIPKTITGRSAIIFQKLGQIHIRPIGEFKN